MRRASSIFVVLLAGLAVSACGDRPGGASGERSGKPVVVASIYPMTTITQQIVGEAAEVVCLVPPGASPHGFEPTASTAAAVARARALVAVGAGYDPFATRMARTAGAPGLVVIQMSPTEDEHDHHDHHHDHDHAHHDHAHEEEHAHAPGQNPHIWLDPVLMREFVPTLGERLAGVLPEHAEAIRRNAAALVGELDAIDAEYRAALAPLKGAKLITFHDAFDVMAARYGIEVAATLMNVDGPGGLTSSRINKALQVIREHKVPAVFTEPQFPTDAGEVLSKETGVRVLTLDPLGDPDHAERSTYQSMMRSNLRTLVDGLGGANP